jgi:hypothetical protein
MIVYMEKWNDRLVHALKVRQKTQADLIRVTGAKGSSVNEWVSGVTKNMRASNAIKVCGFLRINVDWLLYKKGPSGLEEDNLPVYLTPEQQQVLMLLENMAPEAKENWIANGKFLTSVIPTEKAVDTLKTQQLKWKGPERRTGEEDRRKVDLGFDPERRHNYPAINFPQKTSQQTDRRRKSK